MSLLYSCCCKPQTSEVGRPLPLYSDDLYGTTNESAAAAANEEDKEVVPWWKRKRTLTTICVSASVLIFIIIFAVSLTVKLPAAVLLLTTHNQSNIISFNGNDGDPISADVLKLDGTMFENLQKIGHIQLRSMIIINESHLVVVNGQRQYSFGAIFECNSLPGWKLRRIFANNTLGIVHPYGLAYHKGKGWWLITTQGTNSLFILDANDEENPVILPGMNSHFPGSVFSFVPDGKKNMILDTYLPNLEPFAEESNKNQAKELAFADDYGLGLRGLALDEEMGLIFVASQITHNVLVIDINRNFHNIYNITLPNQISYATAANNNDGKDKDKDNHQSQPICILINVKYFPKTVFISDRYHGIYAYRYSTTGASILWHGQSSVTISKLSSGLAVSNDALFVISQEKNTINVFNPFNCNFEFELTHFFGVNPSMNVRQKNGRDWETVTQTGEALLFLPSSHKCALQ